MCVDRVVEYPVQQERHPARSEIRRRVPARGHLVDDKAFIRPDRYQRVGSNENSDLVADQAAGAGLEVERVGDQEQVLRVRLKLGSAVCGGQMSNQTV